MLKVFSLLLVLIFSISWFCIPSSVSAEDAMQCVQSLLTKVTTVQGYDSPTSGEERKQKMEDIKRLISAYFDIESMAHESLGSLWDRISDEEKRNFSIAFKDLFLDSYTRRGLIFLKKEDLAFIGETVTKDGPMVQTQIRRSNDTIAVNYFLKKKDDQLHIVDVDIDGVRMVQSYRQCFENEIKHNSFASLMQKMNIQRKALQLETP